MISQVRVHVVTDGDLRPGQMGDGIQPGHSTDARDRSGAAGEVTSMVGLWVPITLSRPLTWCLARHQRQFGIWLREDTRPFG